MQRFLCAYTFMGLTKRINSPVQVREWIASKAYSELVHFIEIVNESVTSLPIQKDVQCSEGILSVCELLDIIHNKIDSFPAEEQPQRFGNKAFRSWFTWLLENSQELCRTILFKNIDENILKDYSLSFADAVDEVSTYLVESVGNSTRIDYGTGHELAFIAFLLCLFKLRILHYSSRSEAAVPDSLTSVGLVVMPRYLKLVRQLQTVYRMEPAGSHGVWCLDDFQFVPFIWGSRQLFGNPHYDPSTIPNRQVAEKEKDNYLLFSCIDYIYQCKTGPFEEHSNTLYGISQVQKWEKVNSGLIKMYKAEVLAKFPIVQHVLFGHLLPFERVPPQMPKSDVTFQ